jgi:hypothetical protein
MSDSRLQAWANKNAPSEQMLWKNSYWGQIMFVRDEISSLLSRSFEEYNDLVDVVGSHTSKSITCPVYFIDLKDFGVRIWMRYNFYNWNVSVESDKPLTCDFLDVVSPDKDYCFCEGMGDKVFDSYQENKQRFTTCISDHYDLYTFFRCLKKHLGIKRS